MHKINLFAHQKLSEPETEEFLHELLHKIMDMQLKEECIQDLTQQYGVVREKSTARRRIGMPLRWRLAAAIAFIVAATTCLFIFNQKPAYQRLADKFIGEEKLAYADLRKNADQLEQKHLQAVEAYQKENYAEAIQHWTTLKASAGFNEDDQFFLAMSYLYDRNFAAAVITFDQHAAQYGQNGRFGAERLYYQALALLKLDRIEEAKQHLLRLQQTTRSPVLKTRSEILLKTIGPKQ